jgi:hypothetical protein
MKNLLFQKLTGQYRKTCALIFKNKKFNFLFPNRIIKFKINLKLHVFNININNQISFFIDITLFI